MRELTLPSVPGQVFRLGAAVGGTPTLSQVPVWTAGAGRLS